MGILLFSLLGGYLHAGGDGFEPKTKPMFCNMAFSMIAQRNAVSKPHKPDLEDLMTEENFFEIKHFAEKVIDQCRSKDCAIIGVGRSPDIIIKYLQMLGKKNVLSMPMSAREATKDGAQIGVLPKSVSLEFDRFIPKDYSQYLFLDATITGASLFQVSYWGRLHFPEAKIKAISLVQSKEDVDYVLETAKQFDFHEKDILSILPIDSNAEFSKLFWDLEAYKLTSDYETFLYDSMEEPIKLESSSEKTQFLNWLYSLIQAEI